MRASTFALLAGGFLAVVGCGAVTRSNDEKQPEAIAGGTSEVPSVGGSRAIGTSPSVGGKAAAGSGVTSKPGRSEPSAGAPNDQASAGAPNYQAFAPHCDSAVPFKSECSFAETCQQLGCNDGFSLFDAQGCNRECKNSSECGEGQRCRFTVLSGEECPSSSEVEGCWLEGGSCSCSQTADCNVPDICVDAKHFPATMDCPLETVRCAEANYFALIVEGAASLVNSTEKAEAIRACMTAIAERRAQLACPQL